MDHSSYKIDLSDKKEEKKTMSRYYSLFAKLFFLFMMVSACSLFQKDETAEIQPTETPDVAIAEGIVFRDDNNNGHLDTGEQGIKGVSIVAMDGEKQISETVTDGNGRFNFQVPEGSFSVRVLEETLPFGESGHALTTDKDTYGLAVSAGFTASGLDFGYKETESAVAKGTVFIDKNLNGQYDEGEEGLAGVDLVARKDSGSDPELFTSTDTSGHYALANATLNHIISVDVNTLPQDALYELTTDGDEYELTVSPGGTKSGVDFGYKRAVAAIANGLVYEDVNGNGRQDDGESGLGSVTITASTVDGNLPEVSALTTPAGRFRILAPSLAHLVTVDERTLPGNQPYALTTNFENYNLNVPIGYTTDSVDFGYRIQEPAVAIGQVFEDLNENGERDIGEPGIGGALVVASARSNGLPDVRVTTSANGDYRFELATLNHAITVDEGSLPGVEQAIVYTRVSDQQQYDMDVSPGSTSSGLDFGYLVDRSATASGAGGDSGSDSNTSAGSSSLGGKNPFKEPNEMLDGFLLPPDLPPNAGSFSVPKAGLWSTTHFAGQMDCGAFAMDLPPGPSENVTLEFSEDGDTLIVTGFGESGELSATMKAVPDIRGRYTGSFEVIEEGIPVTFNYEWQLVTDEYIIGIIIGTISAEDVTCNINRPFQMIYLGE